MAKDKNKPAGVEIEQLYNTLKAQGKPIPASIQSLYDEHIAAKNPPKPKNQTSKPTPNEQISAAKAENQKPKLPIKLSTAVGMSINDIALTLKKKDPSLSFKDAKKQAKDIKKQAVKEDKMMTRARDTLETGSGGILGKAKYKVLTRIFGKTIGEKISRLTVSSSAQEEAASILAKGSQGGDGSDRARKVGSGSSTKAILGKLDAIQLSIQELKASRTAQPATQPARPTSSRVSEPSSGMSSPSASRIPLAHVDSAVEGQIQKLSGNPSNETSTQLEADKGRADVKSADENKKKKKQLDDILGQLKDIKKKLKTGGIMGLLAGLLAWLGTKFWGRIKGILGTLKNVAVLVGKAVSKLWEFIKKIGKWVADGIKKALSAVGRIGTAIADAMGITEGAVAVGAAGAVAATAGMLKGTSAIANHIFKEEMKPAEELNQKYGLKARPDLGPGKFDLKGKTYNRQDLPQEYQTLIDAKIGDTRNFTAKKAQKYIDEHKDEYKKLEVQKNQSDPSKIVPKTSPIAKQSDHLNSVAADKAQSSNDLPPITVVAQDNRKMESKSKKPDPKADVNIKLRNDEPTIMTYIASIFDHPVVHPGIYRM